MDYCSKNQEFKENPDAYNSLSIVCNGDEHALDFVWRCWNFFHLMDDLVDRDKDVQIAEASRELFMFTQTIALNPFFQNYKYQLLPFILNACNGWIVGESFANGSDSEKRVSPAIKCSDFNLYSYVGFLTGGWSHMRDVDSKFRTYDKE
jgi:hypothetical protein